VYPQEGGRGQLTQLSLLVYPAAILDEEGRGGIDQLVAEQGLEP
jgi:hypothetical protein